jgi:hypothetical protein
MSITLLPDVSNWIFYAAVVLVVVAGALAAVVAFASMFRKAI